MEEEIIAVFVILLIIVGAAFLIWCLIKKNEKIFKERLESGIDKKNIDSFINEYGQEYYGYSYITGWNTYVEKKGRQVTTWKYLYIIPFNIKNDFFDMISIRFTNDNIKMLGRERIFFKEEKIKTEINKDIADDNNPFALDHEREFTDFLNFIS